MKSFKVYKMRKFIFLVFIGFSISLNAQIRLYTIGDSTMATKINPEENPERGWGQLLPNYFNGELLIENRAVNGRSTKSFIDEGKWQAVYDSLKPEDFVFIQFGHNDQKENDASRYTNPHTSYRYNLIMFIEQTREKGATPILFSSIARRNFNKEGTLIDTHGAYPLEMRLVAQAYNVPFIDLQYLTEQLEISYGVEKSKKLHLHYQPGEIAYYPEGKVDDTHLSVLGATLVAEMVIVELELLTIPLVSYLK
jgi:lysophospholipase L1-like esterase